MSEPDPDVVAVARCLRGDAAAFEAIVTRYERVLFSVAHRILGNYDDARDATQNAFIKAYEGLESFDPGRRFFSWIYRIALNECLNMKRGRRPTEPLEGGLGGGHGATLSAAGADAELSAVIDSALERLSHDDRLVVVLRHFADLSYSEIGDVLGIPEKTVKSRLFEARQRLGALLRP